MTERQTIVSNAFSLNMLDSKPVKVHFAEITASSAADYVRNGAVSAVGHANTAAVFADVLGEPVEAQRTTVQLRPGDRLIVGQYRGPRLEEGATSLPEDATIEWTLCLVG